MSAGGQLDIAQRIVGHSQLSTTKISVIGGVRVTWDNIHQWPVSAPPVLPSTPGRFHAAHTHWRWGAVAGDPSSWAAIAGIVPTAGTPRADYMD